MVREPAALLAACAVALAYFLLAGELPDLGTSDRAVFVASAAGVLLIVLVVLALVAAGDAPGPLVLVVLGAGLVVAALDSAADAGAGAVVAEAVLAGSLGMLAARVLLLAGPVAALAVPVFVSLVDVWSVIAGPSSRIADGDPRGAAALTFDLPSWGDALGGPAARFGLPDVLFIAMFATWATRLDLRPRAAATGMLCGVLATAAISIGTDRAIPALPLIALGFLLPNADRLGGLLRRADEPIPAVSRS